MGHGRLAGMNPVSLMIIAVGIALLVTSTLWMTRAYETERLPHWGNPPGAPRRAIALRAVGAGILVLGVVTMASDVVQVMALMVLGLLPSTLVHIAHNRRVSSPGPAR